MKLTVSDIITISILGVVVIGIIVISIVVKKKFGYKKDELPDDLFNKSGLGKVKLTAFQQKTAKKIAAEVYEELAGINITRHADAHKKLLNQSDTMFVAVANEFKRKDNKTMWEYYENEKPAEWIKKIAYIPLGATWLVGGLAHLIRDDFAELREAILLRFSKLKKKGIKFGQV